MIDVVPNAGVIALGKQGENQAVRVTLPNIRAGSGSILLLHQRSDDQKPYPVPVVEADGGIIWTVSSTDTAYPGRGQAELQWLGVNGEVAKSVTYQTNTTRSMAEPGAVPDEPLKPYTQAVAKDAQAAKDAAASATEAARTAEASATQAGISADNAAKSLKQLTDGIASGDFRGQDGKSAYQLAVDAGFDGTETQWLESLKGAPGDTTAADAAAEAAKNAAQEAKEAAEDCTGKVNELKEDVGDIESKFEIETETFVNICSIIRNNTPNNFTGSQITGVKQYFDFGKNATLTKIKMNIKASDNDTVVLEIATLDGNIIATAEKAVTTEYTDVVFDLENIVIKEPVSVFVYTKGTNLLSYGTYGTPYDNPSFSYTFPDGTKKISFKIGTSVSSPTTSNNKLCLVLFFDYTSKVIKNISDSISQNIDTTLLKSGKAADAKVVGDKLSKLEKNINFNNAHTIFVSTSGSDETGDGTEENPYATIYKANETITDSSETNKYEIIVKQGTYTDLQEKYSGVDGNSYQGVVCKPYVTYRSENILKPDLCVLKWDGADGYTKPVTDANCVNKCLFHIPTNSKGVYIKGFTLESKNTRYCVHIETTGSTDECDWHFENCVFNWGGRPDTTEDGTVATACIGTGYSMLEFGEFINCIIKCTNTNHANHMVFQSHDNPDNIFTSIKRGEHLRFENCYFSIADGSDYAHIDLRTTKTSPTIPSFAEFINCSGIKLYVPSETYKKSFVCTEQHTIN